MCLMSHGKLVTNVKRRRRHMAASAQCGRCMGDEEDVFHAVRDCEFAKDG